MKTKDNTFIRICTKFLFSEFWDKVSLFIFGVLFCLLSLFSEAPGPIPTNSIRYWSSLADGAKKIDVDTSYTVSDKLRWFQHGQRVTDKKGGQATVIGVATLHGEKTLCYIIDGEEKISFGRSENSKEDDGLCLLEKN